LQYDLRTFPSPSPEKCASKYDGMGERARECVNREGLYVELLGKVEDEVLTKGRELEQEAMKEKTERERSEKAKAQKKATEEEEAPKSAVTELRGDACKENGEVRCG